jgi:phage shock protein C
MAVATLRRRLARAGRLAAQPVARRWHRVGPERNLHPSINAFPQEQTMSDSDELGKLGDLHQRGILTDEEFGRAKARVLSGMPAARTSPPVNALNQLRRSLSDRWLGGVCGGIAQVTGVPSWAWRLIFTFGIVFAGTGLALYILLWILVPQEQLYLPAPGDSMHAG